MPDPKLDFWTAAWNLAVDQHISGTSWNNSMHFLGLPQDQQKFLEDMLRALQQLPDEADLGIRLLVEARQKHDLEKIRGEWRDLPLSIRIKLEALARGEVKTIKTNWDEPFPPEMSVDEDFEEGERITSKLPYAHHMGQVMNREAYVEQPQTAVVQQPAEAPVHRDTLPVPKNFQASLEARSRLVVPLVPRAAALPNVAHPVFENPDDPEIDEQWTEVPLEHDDKPEN
ncbi:hypothetical protein HZC53_01700 [Candidatus Uhrbacteria bacterium]|nr:hypothetical protein [Candidatus Uhrbacteria bacterium]